MGVNLTNEEYANLIRERDGAINKANATLKILGVARSNIATKKAANPEERKLLNEVLAIVDAAMNKA